MTSVSHNIVCVSTIDWDFIWQGHQEIMSTLARQGHRVLFIENTGVRSATLKDFPRVKHRLLSWRKGVKGIRKVMENLYVYSPMVLPFPYSKAARAINRAMLYLTLKRWTSAMRFENPVIWTWLPTGLALDLIRILRGQLVVYYCCDNFEASSAGSRRIRETEDILVRQADMVFAHSKAIFDRCIRFTDQVYVFQYGFNPEVFSKAEDRPPADLDPIRRPILGYIGGVHQHVDQALLEKVALGHPDKSLVFVGPLQTDVGRLARLSNVHFLGQKRYEELPTYIKHFDIGLIPYVLNEYTKSVYPTKLNEYLIMGKPVVSTQLPEVGYFNQCNHGIVSVADTPDAFVHRIAEELAGDSEERRAQRIRLVEKNAWGEKIGEMQRLIQAKLEEKVKMRELDWQDAFVSFYRSARRKIVIGVATAAIAYGILFYTPALWMLAEPLRMSDQPVAADAIVVLAGGIGESGDHSDAYQEKVKRAADLYQQGFAGKLILSSGAGYLFKEAQVMKALAVSLGVPEDAIILDEIGGGNYFSFLNVKRIMKTHGWSSMLLVVSRYNGARSHLVAKKNFQDGRVIFTSADRSIFFGNEDRVDGKHLRAIVHEYLGILYYWWKGYI